MTKKILSSTTVLLCWLCALHCQCSGEEITVFDFAGGHPTFFHHGDTVLNEYWINSTSFEKFGPLVVIRRPNSKAIQLTGSISGLNDILRYESDPTSSKAELDRLLPRLILGYLGNGRTLIMYPALYAKFMAQARSQLSKIEFTKLQNQIQPYKEVSNGNEWRVQISIYTAYDTIEFLTLEGTLSPLTVISSKNEIGHDAGTVPKFEFNPQAQDDEPRT
jgi:hypothetical protein